MKTIFVTKKQLEKITKTYPTPFHLYDEEGIRNNAKRLKKAFSWNEGFREYFAVKACPNPSIMKILHEEGCGYDCSSLTELMLSEKVNGSGNMIMFSSNDTPREDFVYANKLNAIINLDDITHIDFLKECIGSLPKTMSCRYNPGGVFQLGESKEGFQVMDKPGEAKFGMTKEQLFESFERLKQEGVEEFGIHAFLASNTLSDDYYPELAKIIFELAIEIKEKLHINVSFINLSGGIGIPYKPDQKENDIEKIGLGVKKHFDELLVPNGLGNIKIFTELGRYMLGPYGCIVTRAIHEKHTYRDYIGVDANSCNLMRPAMYGAYHHITVMGKENEPCDHVYDIVGNLCENNDKLAVQRKLPKIDIGDLLVIHDTGAHGFSMGYNYNGRLRSAELLLKKDGTVKLIRRAETIDDYFATLVF